MLTLKLINENTEEVIKHLATKRFDAKDVIGQVIELDEIRRKSQTELDNILSEVNSISKTIGSLMKEGKKEEASVAKEKVSALKETAKQTELTLKECELKIENLLVTIPNLPHESVPEGKGAEDNVIDRNGGEIPSLHENAMPHWD